MKNTSDDYLITPQQTLSVARKAGLGDEQLALSGIAVLTFNRGVVDRLEEKCGLQDAVWVSDQHHPYGAAKIFKRGAFKGMGVAVIVPPMGASPLSCIVEDLVACGAQAVFLVCASWSLGPPVAFGDLILPAYSVGCAGTSTHYGNGQCEVSAAPEIVAALRDACRSLGVRYHVGGNGTCEALYRITPAMADAFRSRGCLCVDNGEASTLLALARTLNVAGGVLFQPYIDLTKGWDPAQLHDERYQAACRLQAEAVLEVGERLRRKGVL